MTKFLFVADVHLNNFKPFGGKTIAGVNERCREALDVLKDAARSAVNLGATLVICGDLFDASNPTPQVMAEVQSILEPTQTVVLLGNHERVSMTDKDHALGPLHPVADVMEKPTVLFYDDVALFCIPSLTGLDYALFETTLTALVKKTKLDEAMPRVLAFHAGVSDEKTPEALRRNSTYLPAIQVDRLMARFGFAAAFCGDWHHHRTWSYASGRRVIVQCGTLVPHSWSDAGLDDVGLGHLFDPTSPVAEDGLKTLSFPGPRFVFEDMETADLETLSDDEHKVRMRWRAESPQEFGRARERLSALKDLGTLQDFDVVVETKPLVESVQRVTKTVTQAKTLEGKINSFIGEMALPSTITAEEVKANCARVLRKAIDGGSR